MRTWDEAYYACRGWILGACFAFLAYARLLSDREVAPAGLALVAAGLGYRLHAGRYIQAHSNHLRWSAGPLATGGPYGLGRHPLYLANLLVALGLVWFAHCLPAWAGSLLMAGIFFHHALLAGAEERFLEARLGEPYARYRESTSRWLGFPRPGPTGSEPEGLWIAWRRQGGNLAKTGAAVLLLWGLA